MEEIYIKYSKLVYNYLYRLTRDIELSEELMQETFYSAIKSISKFKGDCKISVWLCQIAKNKWRDYLKKSRKIQLTSLNEDIEFLISTDYYFGNMSDKDEITQLYNNINKLDESVREVFYLRIKGEFSFKEIAEITGKSEEWARVNFYRGKMKIKEDLLKNEE